MLVTLLKKFENYDATCSITEPRDGHVTFARDASYLKYLRNVDKDMWVIVPRGSFVDENFSKNLKIHYSDYPEFEFTVYHNELYEDNIQEEAIIGEDCKIHPTVVMDVDGLKVVNTPNGEKIHFIHTGRVWIGSDVHIGPYTVIHRGTLGTTVINDGCKIGALNNIGHNCYIGKNVVMAAGITLNGGVTIGDNSWIASGALIKHYTSICENTVVGLGSIVVKDIEKSGIYIGSPSRFLKPMKEGWNF